MKIIIGIMLFIVMVGTAGCANFKQIPVHKLTVTERYELGSRVDKLEGLKPVQIRKIKKEAKDVKQYNK